MDKGWYFRFSVMVVVTVFGWLVLWPSLNTWIPAPAPIREFFTGRISPGLDIRGGLRLTYDVAVDEAVRDRRNLRGDQLVRELGERVGLIPKDTSPTREQLTQVRERIKHKDEGERGLRFTFKSAADAEKLDRDLVLRYGDLREVSRNETEIVLEIKKDFLEQIRDTAVQQARETIQNRVDGLGMREAAVTAQNTDIIVEVPGADQAVFDRIREIISKTARLEFQIVDDESTFVAGLTDLPEGITRQTEYVSAGASKPQVPSGYLLSRGKDARKKLSDYIEKLKSEGKLPEEKEFLLGEADRAAEDEAGNAAATTEHAFRTYTLHGRAEVTGQAIEDAFVANDEKQGGKPYVAINFNSEGADLFKELTGRNVKRRMAIVLDDVVASAPVIQSEIGGGHCQITLGGFRPYNEILNEARDLVVVLKAGALPVPVRASNEQMIGPSLGADGVTEGVKGALVSFTIVLLFMAFYYEMGGVIADIMVILHLLFLLATQAFFDATLSLPGIVAVALNMGMAVDANVLINERIREELRLGKSPRIAVEQGFSRAFSSIFDSQITTLVAGIVLFQYGTGPIKAFAVTLIFGICTSLFTGVFCSRVAFDLLVRGLRVQRLRVG
ncbi:MAG TPA: protein translocase subunit SecD [Polyangiales bacterium]|nr:protein translocase subunit SecD [Polyangiales bacterium]